MQFFYHLLRMGVTLRSEQIAELVVQHLGKPQQHEAKYHPLFVTGDVHITSKVARQVQARTDF